MTPAEFVKRWKVSESREMAHSQMFLTELCDLLDVPHPGNQADGPYAFEKGVSFPDGGTGRIDLYKRGAFVLESKQGSERRSAEEEALLPGKKIKTGTAVRGTAAWDRAMEKAKNQAEAYAKALPHGEGWPPVLIVADVGYCLDLYADFTQAGKAYLQFPDSTGFRLKLADLEEEGTRELLRTIWVDPVSLDPAKKAAAVTRELARRLAKLSSNLEGAGEKPEGVAAFLMRCLFTMFAEDIGLLPARAFRPCGQWLDVASRS